MADQQTPPPSDTNSSAASTTNDSVLGDISIDIPDVSEAPAASAQTQSSPVVPMDPTKIEDISLTSDSSSASSSNEGIPLTISEISTEGSVSHDTNPNPISIDLGDISLTGDLPQTTSTEPTAAPTLPQDDFSSLNIDANIPVAPTTENASVEQPADQLNSIQADELPTPEMTTPEIAVPEISLPTVTPEPVVIELPTPAPTEQTPSIAQQEPTQENSTNEIVNIAPVVVNETPSTQVDTLVANEQNHLTNPVGGEIPSSTQTDFSQEGMTLDLDSLTWDIEPHTATPTNTTPITASVILPTPVTPEQAQMHKSSKKKVMAMAGVLVMLLIVGWFVFRTMMPNESSNLTASMFGSQNNTTTGQNVTGSLSTSGDIASLSGDTQTGSTETGNIAENTTTSGVDITSWTVDNSGTIIASTDSGTLLSGTTSTDTGTSTGTATITKDEAHTTLLTLFKQSKKWLLVALKTKDATMTQTLYKAYKDTVNLLKTLANTDDISTIPDVKAQIDTLQQSLDQANSTLNVQSTVDTQS